MSSANGRHLALNESQVFPPEADALQSEAGFPTDRPTLISATRRAVNPRSLWRLRIAEEIARAEWALSIARDRSASAVSLP